MAEDLLEFENTVEDEDGKSYVAVVVGEEREDGRWVGRIRFAPADASSVLETDRETTQPDRDDLAYWARGLTYFYLEGALNRARRQAALADEAPAGVSASATPPAAPAHLPAHVPRLEVVSVDPRIVEQVMGVREPRPGTVREVPDAGVIVYEGPVGEEGAAHQFAVQFGSRNSGATLANWLWSRLYGAGVEVRVEGRIVELTNDALHRAIMDPPAE